MGIESKSVKIANVSGAEMVGSLEPKAGPRVVEVEALSRQLTPSGQGPLNIGDRYMVNQSEALDLVRRGLVVLAGEPNPAAEKVKAEAEATAPKKAVRRKHK